MVKHCSDEITKLIFSRNRKALSQEMGAFLEQLNILFEILFNARSNYDVWWIYVNKDDRLKYFRVQFHYKEFFETIGRANITTVIIELYKLFDKSNKALSLNKIIKDAQRINIIDKKDFDKLREIMRQAESLWKKIAILRSNLFAHRSKIDTKKEIYRIANITPNQIKELTELGLEILNYIMVKSGKRERQFEAFIVRDTYNVFDGLKLVYKSQRIRNAYDSKRQNA